jgi:DNA-binding PadR family transcriptional regulator
MCRWPSSQPVFLSQKEATVKGAGLQITSRLVTRGYIEIAESHGKDRKYRITPAGEAEWLRLTKSDNLADQP